MTDQKPDRQAGNGLRTCPCCTGVSSFAEEWPGHLVVCENARCGIRSMGMADRALMDELRSAIQAVNRLSCAAKAVGDDDLMYAANRAYHQLYKAEHARAQPEKR